MQITMQIGKFVKIHLIGTVGDWGFLRLLKLIWIRFRVRLSEAKVHFLASEYARMQECNNI